jgi:putative hemolysin
MLNVCSHAQPAAPSRYHTSLAVDDSEIREAQRLRRQVFAGEMGARLSSVLPGHDIDLYDPYCDHLLVRAMASGDVVGTFRILPPDAARRIGSYYSEQEFDLTRLGFLRPGMAELGRSCVHPAHRSVYRQLSERHLAPVEWRSATRCRLPVESLDDGRTAPLPPLIKGYARLGAMVCGEPAWDPDFNTADLLMLLPMTQLNRSYVRRFIG